MSIKLTEEQECFKKHIVANEPVITKARAGVGKTMMGIQAMKSAYDEKKLVGLQVTFGSKNKEATLAEIQKAGFDGKSSTWNSLLFSMHKESLPASLRFKVRLNKWKVSDLIQNCGKFPDRKTLSAMFKANPKEKAKAHEIHSDMKEIESMVGLLKNKSTTTDRQGNFDIAISLFEEFGYESSTMSNIEMALLACEILAASDSDQLTIDFNDQNRFPVINDCITKPFGVDYIIADEAQDNSAPQIEAMRKLSKLLPVSATCDDKQAIYGWRGASMNATELMSDFILNKVSVTINFRCDKTIIRHAQKLVPDIQFYSEKEEGLVTVGDIDFASLNPGDAILGRTNALVIGAAFNLFGRGVDCCIAKGSDGSESIGTNLLELYKGIQAEDVSKTFSNLERWKENQLEKSSSQARANMVEDKFNCISTILDTCSSPDQFVDRVKAVVEKASGGIILSTAHKSKGLQWPRVMILDYPKFRMISKKTTADQKQQEENLDYVAGTRAEHELILQHKEQSC
jgi:hypothetical protein